jgi:hypothetical protein
MHNIVIEENVTKAARGILADRKHEVKVLDCVNGEENIQVI